MYRRHGEKLGLVFLACDLGVTSLAWMAAYALRYALWPSTHGVPDATHLVAAVPAVLVLAAVAYRLCGLYEIHRLQQLPREVTVVCNASGLLLLLIIALTFLRRDLYESRLGLLIFLALNAVMLTLVRRVIWRVLAFFRHRGLNRGRALIVGAGRMGHRVAETIIANPWIALEVVGFVDQSRRVQPRLRPRLGCLEDLKQIVEEHRIDHVFVALPFSRYAELPNVYAMLDGLLAEVQLVPDIPQLAGMRVRTLEVDQLPFLSLRENPHAGWHRVAKRAMDVVLGSAALALFAPAMLLVAALIRLTSPGPVLFRQPRVGLGGESFDMLKFRTMHVNAESSTGPVWTKPNDSRCTWLGRILRSWSVDELPQLINVLLGDMSLVGPRPERKYFTEKFREQLPSYAQRHQVKSGITGWAQVNGWRGDTSLRRRLECDLYYIANWSLWLDLEILWLTLWRGFRNRNAY